MAPRKLDPASGPGQIAARAGGCGASLELPGVSQERRHGLGARRIFDAEAVLSYLSEDLGYAKPSTFILGRSLGSAVAIDVAQDQPLAGLILVSPISSGADFADYHGLGWARWLVGDSFDSLEKLERVSSPILIIHGSEDSTLPIEMGRALYAAAPSGSTLIEVPARGTMISFREPAGVTGSGYPASFAAPVRLAIHSVRSKRRYGIQQLSRLVPLVAQTWHMTKVVRR